MRYDQAHQSKLIPRALLFIGILFNLTACSFPTEEEWREDPKAFARKLKQPKGISIPERLANLKDCYLVPINVKNVPIIDYEKTILFLQQEPRTFDQVLQTLGDTTRVRFSNSYTLLRYQTALPEQYAQAKVDAYLVQHKAKLMPLRLVEFAVLFDEKGRYKKHRVDPVPAEN
ncbi:MAG: hypothetical protein E6Q34_06335 [Burkholderiaceae bacterium]|nr:MAG: hypothetical protein E6Q34_06335 [Burkholderiaceae bacterium]